MLSHIMKVSTILFMIWTAAASSAQNVHGNIASFNQIESILVFISLDMPDKVLQKLYQDAQQSKIPSHLILKKLYNNNLAHTQNRIQKLGIKVIIHPELFEENISQNMPTFIFNRKVGLLILHGNLSLDSATAQATNNENRKH